MIFTSNVNVYGTDWKKVEEDYKAKREKAIKTGPPDCYVVRTGNKLIIFDSRPELGIGVHEFDQEVIGNLKKANIRFIRTTMYWCLVENITEKGKYNQAELEKWDKRMDLLQKNKIIPLIVVHGNAPGCSFANRVESYNRFADFMKFVVSRYKYIRYWELWNEMDTSFTDLFGAGVNGDLIPMKERGKHYAEMLKLVYPVIKEANPEAIVLAGGSASGTTDFQEGIYEGGGKDYFDIMGIHTYGVPLQWSFVLTGIKLQEAMQKHGDGTKPIWNTEFGIDAGNFVAAWGLPEGDQGEYFDRLQKEEIAECIEFNLKSGLFQKILPYQYAAGNERQVDALKEVRLPAGMTLDDYGFGFMRKDGKTPRPVFQYIINTNPNGRAGLEAERTVTIPLIADNGKVKKIKVKVRSNYPLHTEPVYTKVTAGKL